MMEKIDVSIGAILKRIKLTDVPALATLRAYNTPPIPYIIPERTMGKPPCFIVSKTFP